MNPTFGYHIDDRVFHTRLDFIEHCEKQDNPRELFDTGKFQVYNLPTHIDIKEKIDPIDATARWMNKIKEDGKPTVLLFGGGLDSTLVLDFMMRSNNPPDYILTTTIDPFDNPDFLSGLDMEARYSLKYTKEIISNNSVLRNTNIWHNHLGKEYAEKIFSSNDWLRTLTLFHSVESLAPHKFLPGLSDDDKNHYTFIKGGNFPKVQIVEGETPQFYLVDLQLGTAIDTPVKYTYDFILDNPEMFKYMTLEYYKQVTKADKSTERSLENMFECHTDHSDKRYLDDFSKFIPTMPPILDKRFETLLPWIEDLDPDPSMPYYSYLHRTGLKSWMVYLQAEWMQPNWFQNYKKTFIENEEWIRRMHSYPGKLTTNIKIKDH